ncbi:MAG: leucyl aminopeptidase [Candidatus Sericytochromatia bacterium]|nr:leucyl aminopeptidase [Candidatus Sericytochromatia bacterium]
MQLHFEPAPLSALNAEALLLGLAPAARAPTGFGPELDAAIAVAWRDGAFAGKDEEVLAMYPVGGLVARRVVLLGLGSEPLTPEAWRRVVARGVLALRGKVARLAIALPDGLAPAVAAYASTEAAALSAYDGRLFQTQPRPDEKALESLVLPLAADSEAAHAAARGRSLAAIVNRVRDLSNMPGNKLSVPDLRDAAVDLARRTGMTHRVFEQAELVQMGFGCLVGVGQGSQHGPCFVVLEYHGHPDRRAAPIVLAGKGITFDTGGICIKPRAGMEEMKTDMHGAATVLGVLEAAHDRSLPVNLVALLPIAENMPSGRALKPGDLLTAYNGLVVEAVDTDAEGRLILADALAYGAKHYDARVTVDVATLTGSIIMALGYEASGLFSTDDDLAARLAAAGEATGERLWRFPVWEAYDHHIQSDIADLRNIHPGKGDAITGAVFLKRFAGQGAWAHIDIAGPSYLSEARGYNPKGSTGHGVRLLLHWLEQEVSRG